MNLRVVALGHRMPDWVTAGWNDYARRMPRDFGLELVELKPEPRDRGKPVPHLLAAEAVRIDDSVRRQAAAIVSLSAMTLPHGLVRVVIAEQLYRAVSLLGGHPYHRD